MYINAGYSPQNFIPQEWRDWDTYNARLQRYEVFEGYYNNLAYHKVVSYSQSLKTTESLYKHVRGVYNPVKRLVDSYVSKIYGGMLDTEKAQSGAIPISTENELLIPAITTLWKDSRWGQKKSVYVRNGAKLGDSFLKVVDSIDKRRVWIEPVDPMKIKRVEKDSDGTIIYIEFEYFIRYSNQLVKYCETITPEKFEAYAQTPDYNNRGNLSFSRSSIHENGRGELISEWDNEYGFVPVVHVQHTDEDLMFGAPVMHGLLHKVNELNDIASILNDGMRNQVNLPMVAINATIGTVDFGSDQSSDTNNTSDNPKKDTMRVLNIKGDNADLKTLTPTINIADGLQNIVEILKEIERDSPELSLHRLREAVQLTAPGVRSAYDDAISKYQEARGNYDTGLIEAQRMAIAIGGMRGYDGYQGFSLMSLEDGSLDHQISERPVINDSIGKDKRLELTLQAVSQNMPKTFYLDMGWSDSEADDYVNAGQSARDSFMMTSPFETATTTPAVEDEGATPEDAFNARENSGLNAGDLLNADRLLAEVG